MRPAALGVNDGFITIYLASLRLRLCEKRMIVVVASFLDKSSSYYNPPCITAVTVV